MNYHSQEAFTERMVARKADPVAPAPFAAFYHIACLNSWQEIVQEQLRLAGHVGLAKLTSCILGSQEDAKWCVAEAKRHNVELVVNANRPDLNEWEHPTLNCIYEYACHNPTGAVLYFHSKGVRLPDHKNTQQWRRVMSKYLVADWKTCLKDLAIADAVGVGWVQSRNTPHFQGNFWMARCDWIAHLPSPHALLCAHGPHDRRFAGQSWQRMHSEAWLGSMPYHHIESKIGMDIDLMNNAFPFNADIPGFSWE